MCKLCKVYGSETWCLTKNEMAILRRTEKAMMRAISGVKLTEKRWGQELMSLVGVKNTLDGLVRASGVRWYGHISRRDSDEVLRRALVFKVVGKRERGRPNMTWKRQVEEHINKIGLNKKDTEDRTKWRNGVYELFRNVR